MIKTDELKQKLYEYLKDERVLSFCFDDIRNDTEPSEENISKRQYLAKEILKAGKTGGRQLTETEIEDYKKLKNKRSAKKVLTDIQKDINQVESSLIKKLDSQEYNAYLDHVIYNQPLREKDYISSEIDENFLVLMYAIFRHAFRYCFYDNSGITDEQFKSSMNAIIYTGAIEGIYDKDLDEYLKQKNRENPIIRRVKEIGESEEEFLNIVNVYKEISGRINALADEEEQDTKTAREESSLTPQKIFVYPDNLTIAETDILNVLTTQKFNIDFSVFKKSDETLNSLSHQDREILDYIVLTLYPNDQTVFSDYQIATGLYKEQTGETVSDSMLKAINDSIDHIRNVRIDEGFISAEKIGDIKAEVKINDHLITLRQVDIKQETKTTWYRIIGDPFYYDYAVKTGKINRYKKQLITRDIKDEHIQHNIKNDTLKMMLARRVISLKYYKQTIINMAEIYDILGLKDSRDYTKARGRAKEMLEDLQGDYNFKYSFKKKGRTTTRLILERYTDRPLEIEKTFS